MKMDDWKVDSLCVSVSDMQFAAAETHSNQAAPSLAVVLPFEMPQAEYMYGCTATAVAMMLAYYDRYGITINGTIYSAVAFIPGGEAELNSRGLDGNIYNMNSFNTLVGGFTASKRHVKEFFETTPESEFQYSFVNGGTVTDTSRWDCIADFLGTNQFWRGNEDYATTYWFVRDQLGSMSDVAAYEDFTVSNGGIDRDVNIKNSDLLWGLERYFQTLGLSLDKKKSGSFLTDNNPDGRFSFEDYKAQIDAGRVVIVQIEGHSMVGYGYDAATREIIFDDTYQRNCRMKWNGSYYYSGESRRLLAISVVEFTTQGFWMLPQNAGALQALATENDQVALTPLKFAAKNTDASKIFYTVTSSVAGGILYLDVNNNNIVDAGEGAVSIQGFSQADLDSGRLKFVLNEGATSGKFNFKVSNFNAAADRNQRLWTSEYTFLVGSNSLPSAVLAAPAVTGEKVLLDWSDVPTGFLYELEYGAVGGMLSRVKLSTSQFTFAHLDDGAYQWRVRVIDPLGFMGNWVQGSEFRVDTIAPGKPGMLNAKVDSSGAITLMWSGVSDASGIRYMLEFTTMEGENKEETTLTVKENIWNGKLPDNVYSWRVQAVDGCGNVGGWATGSEFRVDTVAAEVTDFNPVEKLGNMILFSWAIPYDSSGIATFDLEYADNAGLQNPIRISSAFNRISLKDLSDGSYFWRVRCTDKLGHVGQWSAVQNFFIDNVAPDIPVLNEVAYADRLHTFSWQPVADASGISTYMVELADNASFSKAIRLKTPGTSLNPEKLKDGVWFWRVRAVDGAGNEGKWSGARQVLIDTAGPEVAATGEVEFPEDGVRLNWLAAQDPSGVAGYELEYGTDAGFAGAVRVVLAQNSALVKGLQPGLFHWRVRAVDKLGNVGNWLAGSSFEVAGAEMRLAELVAPTVNARRVTLNWTPELAGNPRRYEVEVAENAEFKNARTFVCAAAKLDLDNLTETKFFWRVRVLGDGAQKGRWYAGDAFRVDLTPPTSPAALTPIWKRNDVILQWTHSHDLSEVRYELEYSRRGDFVGAERIVISGSELTVSALAQGNYFWRVRAVDGAGNVSAWQEGEHFFTPGFVEGTGALLLDIPRWDAIGGADRLDQYDIKVAAGKYQLEVKLPAGAKAKVALYSADGRKCLASASCGRDGVARIAGKLLEAGSYLVRVSALDKKTDQAEYQIRLSGEVFAKANMAADDDWKRLPATAFTEAQIERGALLMSQEWVGYGDRVDYGKLMLTDAGKYDFTISGVTQSVVLSLFAETNGKLKKIKSITVKAGSGRIAGQLLNSGSYCVSVTSSTAAKGGGSDYSVVVSGEVYSQGNSFDDLWQNARTLELATPAQNWVGFGDRMDFYKIDLADPGRYALRLREIASPVTLTLYAQVKGKLKKLKGITVKSGGGGLENLLLPGQTYYVSVTGNNAAKGQNTAYRLEMAGEVFSQADNADDTWRQAKRIVSGEEVNGWVGFGDQIDYASFELRQSTTIDLALSELNAGSRTRITLFSETGGKLKKVKTATISKRSLESWSLALNTGNYCLAIENLDAAKGRNTDYSLQFNARTAVATAVEWEEDKWAKKSVQNGLSLA